MSAARKPSHCGNVEQIYCSAESTPVSDELQKLTAMLAPLCPRESGIKFDFDAAWAKIKHPVPAK